jgi:hypothetical protein
MNFCPDREPLVGSFKFRLIKFNSKKGDKVDVWISVDQYYDN